MFLHNIIIIIIIQCIYQKCKMQWMASLSTYTYMYSYTYIHLYLHYTLVWVLLITRHPEATESEDSSPTPEGARVDLGDDQGPPDFRSRL